MNKEVILALLGVGSYTLRDKRGREPRYVLHFESGTFGGGGDQL